MKRSLKAIIVCLTGVVLLAGCEGKTDASGSPEGSLNDKPETVKEDTAVDLTSEEGILSYLAGDWTLLDRETGEDHGTLAIKEDGSFEFTRLSDKATGSGKLSFGYSRSKKGEEPDTFSMKFDDCKNLIPEGTELYGDEGTGGVFHIGTFDNKDRLYLKEIGNGDTIVSMYVFNTKENSDEIGDWSYDWLFCRDNDTEDPTGTKENETFYAWAWETDEDGVWLQSMADHEYETVEEYTDLKYLGGYFNETDDIGAAHYAITRDTDLSELVNTRDWNSGYPLMICEVSVDGKGNVKKLRDVDIMMYSSYYMGDVKHDFSYKDRTFIIDGYEIDITPFAPDATAIVDAKQVGDWIIVECHNNPNISTYLFYNIPNGLMDYFEYEIDGANLIWQGDDLSTAVYQRYNEIYDIWGHQIGHVNDGELYELSFKDRNTIVAKCWIVDEIGREKEFTEEFEYEPCDGAVWAYYEYLLGGANQWRRLKEMAEDATALIIVNPPVKIIDRMSSIVSVNGGALDRVIVVPLFDDSVIRIGSKRETPEKGRSVLFEVTVPEGMATETLIVKAPGRRKAEWEIVQLSGKNPQMSTFIRSENGRETSEKEADYNEIYAPVFDEIFDVLDYGFNIDREYKYVSGGLSEKVMYSKDEDLLKSIGYQLTDLSGDGVPELLIGSDEEYDDNRKSFIYTLCTIKDDCPVCVASGSTRSSYNYMGNGHLYYQGSGGASITIFGENHLSSDGSELVWDDFYFSDEKENGEIGIYHNNTGVFGANDADEINMSETEFGSKMSDYQGRCVPIHWTPIGQYRYK